MLYSLLLQNGCELYTLLLQIVYLIISKACLTYIYIFEVLIP